MIGWLNKAINWRHKIKKRKHKLTKPDARAHWVLFHKASPFKPKKTGKKDVFKFKGKDDDADRS